MELNLQFAVAFTLLAVSMIVAKESGLANAHAIIHGISPHICKTLLSLSKFLFLLSLFWLSILTTMAAEVSLVVSTLISFVITVVTAKFKLPQWFAKECGSDWYASAENGEGGVSLCSILMILVTIITATSWIWTLIYSRI